MPITVGVDEAQKIIRATAEGEVRLVDMTHALREALDIIAAGGPRKALMDATRLNHAPVFDIIESMREVPHSLRIAVTMSERSQSDVLFAKSEADKRNLNYEVFWDEQAALDWLHDDS